MEYALVRSERKTVAIYIRSGAVEVRAPLRTPKREIDAFVSSKEKWIAARLAEGSEQAFRKENFRLGYGDFVLYRGEPRAITASAGGRIGVSGDGFYIPPDLSSGQIKSACVRIYRILAESDLTVKAYGFAGLLSVMPSAVKVGGAKTRWGSCSANGSVNFSWRLIMADDGVIDYVIVHELAHLTEMNHSKRFWAVVERVLPDYRERRKRLREFQQKFDTEDWD
ncbi:MAG: M48 family metallopeptidase [Oscillospiraceae bacterium]|jgi:predicted metal-dependent hydrolase|nr:M48 family metallopeptidase [Oscillospiraceae bacterium]